MYKADMGTWILGYFLIIVITVAVQFPASLYAIWKVSSGEGPRSTTSADGLIVTFAFSILAAVVGGVLHAGYYRIALQRTRLIAEGVGGIFNLNGQGLALALWSFLYSLPMLVVAIIYNAMAPQPDFTNQRTIDFAALFGPLILYFAALLFVTLLIFPFVLTPLIIVDQKLGIGAAAKKSWQTVSPKYLPAVGFYIAISFLAGLGFIVCGIGALFTLTLFPLTLCIVYRDFFIPPITSQPYVYPQEGPSS